MYALMRRAQTPTGYHASSRWYAGESPGAHRGESVIGLVVVPAPSWGDQGGRHGARGDELLLTAEGLVLVVVDEVEYGIVHAGEVCSEVTRSFRPIGAREALRRWSAATIVAGIQRAVEQAAREARHSATLDEQAVARLARVRAALQVPA